MAKSNLTFFKSEYIFFPIILLGLISGCSTKMFEENVVDNRQLTLFAFLVADSVFSVHLSKSVEYNSIDDFERIYNGYIMVEKNEEKVDSFAFPYRYLWSDRPAISINENDFFLIRAGDSEGNNVWGSTIIPQKISIEQIDTTRVGVYQSGTLRNYLECKIVFQDPPDIDNYYQLIVTMEEWKIIDGKQLYSTMNIDYLKTDSVFFIKDQSGSLLSGIDFKGTFSDYKIEGKKYPLTIRIPAYYFDRVQNNMKRSINFILLSQTADYFNYFRTRIIAEYNYDLPIIDPIKIHGNIDGGLGLIGGMASTSMSLVFTGSDF
ncbi:MAG: DUF4249 domain-containing protein [Marinilabiliaceae bacterium]|nr:DUF4249 domain-containing protein [Marinilabiliaceae bacterium]